MKALCLGAKAVLIGRPVLWGLSDNGDEGLERLLRLLKEELTADLMSLGCNQLSELGPDFLYQQEKAAL